MAPSGVAPVVVVGGYAGTVVVLADILRTAGIHVAAAAAIDADGQDGVRDALTAVPDAVVVMTVSPADPTARLALAAVPTTRVCAVAWHPADERPDLPAAVRVVEAGRITADLAEAVRGLSWS